jgi:hypothetical protein
LASSSQNLAAAIGGERDAEAGHRQQRHHDLAHASALEDHRPNAFIAQ